MAAPMKPWEKTGVNQQNDSPGYDTGTNFMSSNPSTPLPIGSAGAQALSQPPPLPPRPTTQMNSTSNRYGYGMGGYGGGGYGGGGMGGYGGMSYGGMYNSPYSSYGGYGGYGMNRYGMNGMNGEPAGAFSRQAEESSRPAFESIESIVNAFTSVSMMLDSTFQAVYNSFRAVIGVADNFARLKIQLMQVVSALAFIRTLKYMYRRLLEVLRLRPPGTAVVEWNNAFAAAAKTASSDPEARKSSWPILMFFGIILGGPWLIWKLIASFTSSSPENTSSWSDGQEDHFVADVLYDFTGETGEELSVNAGQKINVAPKELQPRVRGWLLASNNGKTGLVPATYVKVLGKRRGQKTMALVESAPNLINENPIQPTESSLNLVPSHPIISDSEMDSLFSEKLPNVDSVESTSSKDNSNQRQNTESASCSVSKTDSSTSS